MIPTNHLAGCAEPTEELLRCYSCPGEDFLTQEACRDPFTAVEIVTCSAEERYCEKRKEEIDGMYQDLYLV